MDVIEILSSSAVFSVLNKNLLAYISDLAEKRTYAEGDFIFKEGDLPDYCYLIIAGRIEISRNYGGKKKGVVAELYQGSIVGELAIIDGLPRSASAQALEATETLAVSEWDFKKLMKSSPEIALELLPIVANRLRQAQDELYLAHFVLTV